MARTTSTCAAGLGRDPAEWALAGCKAFIAAPRSRTAGKSLEGRAFLHTMTGSKTRNGFGVLELIMTAPVVVASWISLQYYGSSVAPEAFGGGNKLMHNVTGGIGVVEGNGGTLRPACHGSRSMTARRYGARAAAPVGLHRGTDRGDDVRS
jgi:uncharacterized protein YbcC (UPF0753/DUF2309 family)